MIYNPCVFVLYPKILINPSCCICLYVKVGVQAYYFYPKNIWVPLRMTLDDLRLFCSLKSFEGASLLIFGSCIVICRSLFLTLGRFILEETGRHFHPSRIIFDFEVTTFFSFKYLVPGIQEAYRTYLPVPVLKWKNKKICPVYRVH
jgi:hypothetical protein